MDAFQRVLFQLLSSLTAFSGDELPVSEHAVSALGILLRVHRTAVDVASIVPLWLRSLPVRSDRSDSLANTNLLCFFMQRFNIDPTSTPTLTGFVVKQ